MKRYQKKLNRPTAVLVGMGVNGLGVTRALARHQISSIALAPLWEPACATNTCRVHLSREWHQEAVIEELLKIGAGLGQKGPLMITSDDAVPWVSEAREQLAEFYEINLPSKETVRILSNKGKFLELARKEKWPTPLSWKIDNRDELMSLVGGLPYPCILKPQTKSKAFSDRYLPHKAFKAAGPRELISLYNEIRKYEKEILIQEWIEGGEEKIAFCLTYCNREGKPLTFFTGRKLRQWPIRCGSTAISEPAPKEWHDQLTLLTEKIWRTVGFKGFGSIEYKIFKDRAVIVEPTIGRTNYQSELAVINGVNIPAIGYYDLAGLEFFPSSADRDSFKLINGRDDFSAALAYFRLGELTISDWLKSRSGKKKYVFFRTNDPGPFIASAPSTLWDLLSECSGLILGNKLKTRLKKNSKDGRPRR